jgi:predicted phosphodiesterase
MIIIGDIHGKINQYKQLTNKYPETICVGDFGFKKQWDWLINDSNIDSVYHKINMGNHDYIPYVNCNYSLGNWSYYKDIFTIRGADSIDKMYRIEGLNWFRDEEISYLKSYEILEAYERIKPKIVVTHDCPQIISEIEFNIYDKSITRNLLQELFLIHQPNLWIFGHHHESIKKEIKNTIFICLNELETFDLNK